MNVEWAAQFSKIGDALEEIFFVKSDASGTHIYISPKRATGKGYVQEVQSDVNRFRIRHITRIDVTATTTRPSAHNRSARNIIRPEEILLRRDGTYIHRHPHHSAYYSFAVPTHLRLARQFITSTTSTPTP